MRLFCLKELPQELQAGIAYRELQPKEILYRQNDCSVAVFCVVQGRLRLYNHTDDGGTVPLYVIRPGECVSEAALFAERYCSDAVAEVHSVVSILPKPLLAAALAHDFELAKEFMILQSGHFNEVRRRMELRSIRAAKKRVLQYLQLVKAPDSSRLWLDRPLKSLAEDVGLAHETFYRTIAQLEREGSIRWSGNTIIFPPQQTSIAPDAEYVPLSEGSLSY